MDNKEFIKLLRDLRKYSTETEWIEFKVNWYKPDGVGEYIAALSNSAATFKKPFGYLIWGIDNLTHKFVGTKFNYLVDVKGESLAHYLARNLSPSVAFDFNEGIIEKKRIIILIINCAKGIPVSYKNERYLRIGSSNTKLSKYPEREILLFKELIEIPKLIETESNNQNLKFNEFKYLYKEAGKEILNEESFFKNIGFYTNKGKFNSLANLLADENMISLLFCKFQSTEKDSDADKMNFGHQCLIIGSNKMIDYVKSFINTIHIRVTSNPKHEKQKLFDDRAFREAWINAIQYTDWNEGAYPTVFAYSDRIEIESYGGLPTNLSKEDFFNGIKKPKSPELTEIFLELSHTEHMGYGVPYIVSKYGRDAFIISEHKITVSLPYKFLDPLDNENSDSTHQKNYSAVIAQAENNAIHVKSMIENSSISPLIKNKLLTIYLTFNTNIFGRINIMDIFHCSSQTAGSYLEILEKVLNVIVLVKGQGKGKYRFSELPFFSK